MGFRYRITVFTPTYNRAYTLPRVYECLRRQSFADFEWLVIDDGSSDGTEALVRGWAGEENPFPIRYYWFENAGKQREINRALKLAQGALFLVLDSDDTITSDALERIDGWERTLPRDGTFCGVAGNMQYSDRHIVNPLFGAGYQDSTMLARMKEACGADCVWIGADRAWAFYTEVFRRYPYPEFEGERFISEAVTWNRMAAAGYRIRCFNEIIYEFEHMDDGYTASITRTLLRNPRGYGLWKAETAEFLHYGFRKRLMLYYSFYCDFAGQYPAREIAGFVHCPVPLMELLALCYRVRHGRKV